MSAESEKLIELAGELGRRVNSALGELIPAEAHDHLVKAQKELLSALFLIYEHQVGARGTSETPARRTDGGAERPSADRVQRIEIE